MEAPHDQHFIKSQTGSSVSGTKILFEPRHEKTNNMVSEQVRHKPSYTSAEYGWRLETLGLLESRGILLSIHVAKTKALISFAITAKLIRKCKMFFFLMLRFVSLNYFLFLLICSLLKLYFSSVYIDFQSVLIIILYDLMCTECNDSYEIKKKIKKRKKSSSLQHYAFLLCFMYFLSHPLSMLEL